MIYGAKSGGTSFTGQSFSGVSPIKGPNGSQYDKIVHIQQPSAISGCKYCFLMILHRGGEQS